ncbi:MAG: polyprenyl synthetase family protein [Persicimonas sp.]
MNAQAMLKGSRDEESFVGRVERRIARVLEAGRPAQRDSSKVADDAAGYLTKASSAKRARPRLLSHFGEAVGVSEETLVELAAAAELIHTASLMHDDVVDEATTRRNLEAVHLRWSNQVAILGGDLLLCHGLKLLEPYPAPVYHSAVDVVSEMTRGIVREVEARYSVETTLSDWRMIATGKTAALLGWCGRAPGLVAGSAEISDRLDRCGRHLGVAFQLADDLKDLLARDAGKDRFADIKNGNPSYPLISATDAQPVRERLERAWEAKRPVDDGAEVKRLGGIVLEAGVIEPAVAAIREEIERAVDALGAFASKPGGREVRQFAQLLVESVDEMTDAAK